LTSFGFLNVSSNAFNTYWFTSGGVAAKIAAEPNNIVMAKINFFIAILFKSEKINTHN